MGRVAVILLSFGAFIGEGLLWVSTVLVWLALACLLWASTLELRRRIS